MRTIIDIPEEQKDALDALAENQGVSRTELVRRAIARYLEEEEISSDASFGIWRDLREDGVDYQNRLRDEWGREG